LGGFFFFCFGQKSLKITPGPPQRKMRRDSLETKYFRAYLVDAVSFTELKRFLYDSGTGRSNQRRFFRLPGISKSNYRKIVVFFYEGDLDIGINVD